eukprot:CAMPEP_0118667534 /NCGR_PEP_ID=MMETSP0785-20121206/19842_1 /TAXON_ID=91992 /ORGANISM="Bolidomonas pacifica, Strain CCMP 1866" /LENGTH=747 /DNA_ID=CAMNT_0006562003 /DNA_START=90 /DNA_END=2333 /DNA_ORIENTATION=+
MDKPSGMVMMKPLKKKRSTEVASSKLKPVVLSQPSNAADSSDASEIEMLREKVKFLESQLKENASVLQVRALSNGSDSSSDEDEPDLNPQRPPAKPAQQEAPEQPPISPSPPPGVLRPSTYSNRASPASSDQSGQPLKNTIRRASFGKESAPTSSKPSRSSSPDLIEKHFKAPTLGAPRGGELGFVDMGRVPEIEKTIRLENDYGETTLTTMTPSSSNTSLHRAVPEVGRVVPAGHKKYTDENEEDLMAGRRRFESQESCTTLESVESDYVDDVEFKDQKQLSPLPKTPAGVTRLHQPVYPDVDLSTTDIFSPNNISQGACLEKFGYAPGEIISKLVLEKIINENEDRLIRYLLARDDRVLLSHLITFETNGITKATIGGFRDWLEGHIRDFRNSPVHKKKRADSGIFDKEEDSSLAPERPNTAIPTDPNPKPTDEIAPVVPFKLVIHKVLVKIAMRLRDLGPDCKREKVILVGSGCYNPLHRLHLRMFYLARSFLEGHSHFEVLGGIVSLCHQTVVRQKFRQKPKEIIPPKHRLSMARLAVGDSAWLTVDPWEITRRRVLDYLSVLDHIREIVDSAFPDERIRLIFLTDGNQLPKLSSTALTQRNCNCLCICRPMSVDILLKQLTQQWKQVAYVLEDTAILSNDLEGITSSAVRRDAIEGKDVSKQLCKKVFKYMKRHQIPLKMAGCVRWNKVDKEFDFEGEDETDRPYVQMPESLMVNREKEREEERLLLQSGAVRHKQEFSLLW